MIVRHLCYCLIVKVEENSGNELTKNTSAGRDCRRIRLTKETKTYPQENQ